MNARFAWLAQGSPAWTETQDIVVYPGCNRMTVDLATDPAIAVNDENTTYKFGWRGQIARSRPLRPERGSAARATSSSARSSSPTTLPSAIAYDDQPSSTPPARRARPSTSTRRRTTALYDGVKIASASPGRRRASTRFTWNGTRRRRAPRCRTARTRSGSCMKQRSGCRHRRTPPGRCASSDRCRRRPATFVPISPVRLLDTRTGQGGNIVALGERRPHRARRDRRRRGSPPRASPRS